MKKITRFCLVALFAVLSINTVKAQNIPVSIGVKAGVNYNNLQSSFSGISDRTAKAGFHIGVFSQIGGRLYFQPELNYRMLQSEYTYNSKSYKPKFHQLNMPLMVGYKIINSDDFKLRVSAGPEVNYNLNKADAPDLIDYKRFSLAGVLNAGVDFGRFSVDARYSGNITINTKSSLENFNALHDYRRGIFSVSVGYKLW